MTAKRKLVYYVDLPNPFDPISETSEGEWVHVGTYDTKQDALQALEERWGIGAEDADLFISFGTIWEETFNG